MNLNLHLDSPAFQRWLKGAPWGDEKERAEAEQAAIEAVILATTDEGDREEFANMLIGAICDVDDSKRSAWEQDGEDMIRWALNQLKWVINGGRDTNG